MTSDEYSERLLWGLPQGTSNSTRQNTDFTDITGDVEVNTDTTTVDDPPINGTVLTGNGVIVFTEQAVYLFDWNGHQQWQHTPDERVLTCGRFDSTVVVVTPDKIIGLSLTDGSESWETSDGLDTTAAYDTAPVFTGHLTECQTEPAEGSGEASNAVCIGTQDKAGVVAIDPDAGSAVNGYVHEGTGKIEDNPTYDAEHEVVVVPFSNSVVGVDATTFEVEFEVFAPVRGLSTFDGVSVVYVEQGYLTGIDTTKENYHESTLDTPSDSRILWEYHVDDEDTIKMHNAPCRIDDQFIFPTESGIEAYSIETGSMEWEQVSTGRIRGVASSESYVYGISTMGRTHVLDGGSGEKLNGWFTKDDSDVIEIEGENIVLGREHIVFNSESKVAIASEQEPESPEGT